LDLEIIGVLCREGLVEELGWVKARTHEAVGLAAALYGRIDLHNGSPAGHRAGLRVDEEDRSASAQTPEDLGTVLVEEIPRDRLVRLGPELMAGGIDPGQCPQAAELSDVVGCVLMPLI